VSTTRRGGHPAVAALALLATVLLLGLGVWQLYRLQQKQALIAQVAQRLAAAPIPAPGPAAWPRIGSDDAYTRIAATGRWRPQADTYVQAVTALGPGYWLVTPLDTGVDTILVNRGFVPEGEKGKVPLPGGFVHVQGLLRVSEPGGGFLRSNDAAQDRWFSRDVAAIARARGVAHAAPYFIDAADDGQSDWPRGGLTVVRFPNNHLIYALTWFGLAGLAAWFAFLVVRGRRSA
jgi:surfeit locus 1 family protein